jgi:hypothetical protein
MQSDWTCVLELADDRSVKSGSSRALVDAIARGADLHVVTRFRFDEHIDINSSNDEPVEELMKFPVTYLIDHRWVAAVQNLRQPVQVPDGFGPRPSMSFFLYNQDGEQAVARPFLDGPPKQGRRGPSAVELFPGMAKMHQRDSFDADTNAPSMNFVYDFDYIRFHVRDRWREVLRHDAAGEIFSGSVDELSDCFRSGRDVKVAVSGACEDLGGEQPSPHELFSPVIATYFPTRRKLFLAATQPVVRVRPGIPLRYASGGWDFGWLIVRTDGMVARTLYDPYTLKPTRSTVQCAMRWFVS